MIPALAVWSAYSCEGLRNRPHVWPMAGRSEGWNPIVAASWRGSQWRSDIEWLLHH